MSSEPKKNCSASRKVPVGDHGTQVRTCLPKASPRFVTLLRQWGTHDSVVSRHEEGSMPIDVRPWEMSGEPEVLRFMAEYPHFGAHALTLIGRCANGDLVCCDNSSGQLVLLSLGDSLWSTDPLRSRMKVVAQSIDSAIERVARGEDMPITYYDAKAFEPGA